MSLLHSILLGILQGVTEFLPVSSSGHLAILKNMFHIDAQAGVLFDTMLHLGTLVAVCIVYWSNFSKMVVAFFQLLADCFTNIKIFISGRGKADREPYVKLINNAYKKFVVLILITSIPTAVIGLLLSGFVETAQRTLLIPGICLVITAIILLVGDSSYPGKKKVKKAKYGDAAIIGVAQGIAVMPGISRSGATITACMLLGFDKVFAIKYSFIASIPAILGANLLQLRKVDPGLITGSFMLSSFLGMIAAGVVGFVCLKLLITLVRSNRFRYFAYYCAVVGIICIIFYFIKG